MTRLSSSAIIIMTRAPIAGATKTRLEACFSPEECAELHKAFLLDTIELTSKFRNVTVFLAFTPQRQRELFEKMLVHPVVLLPQRGNNLGKRIYEAVKTAFSQGFSPIITIGSDSPTLQPLHIEKAFKALKAADVCLGPSQDGGYYLIGMRLAHKKLFEGIPWGENKVFKTTVGTAKRAGFKIEILPEWYDVDTPNDLRRLRSDLAKLKRIPKAFVPPRTETLLRLKG